MKQERFVVTTRHSEGDRISIAESRIEALTQFEKRSERQISPDSRDRAGNFLEGRASVLTLMTADWEFYLGQIKLVTD